MSAIHFSNVSFAYSTASPIVADVSLDLGPGWAGLVGANGSGKSTVLALVAGDLAPDRGTIRLEPDRGAVLCPQRVDDLTPDIVGFGADWNGATARLRSRLGLEPGDLDRWTTLSPGERKRWQVGAALAADPPILLLDEPTNHLDAEGRDLLVGALAEFSGCGVIVSHDRAVLDDLTATTLRLTDGHLAMWSAPYSVARDAWVADRQAVLDRREQLKGERRAVGRELAAQRNAAAEKQARRVRERRSAGRHDLDTRGAAATARYDAGQAAGARRRATTRSRLETLDGALAANAVTKELGGDVTIASRPAPKEFVAAVDGPVMAGTAELFDLSLGVRRSDRLRLAGPNGSGKTSLLLALLEGASVPGERVLYLPQEADDEQVDAWLQELFGLPPVERGDVLSVVAALGSDPGRLLESERPSPGEARKLALALGLGVEHWLLLLDEPTNHLDLPSIERLETALNGYRGALVLVTHDDGLAASATTETISVGEVAHRR